MPEERICAVCGRSNPVSQPRCIGCGQRAAGTVLVPESKEQNGSPQWWHTPPPSSPSSIPPPPQVQEQINKAESDRALAEIRAADEAKRREETARRIAEARERLAERQRASREESVQRAAEISERIAERQRMMRESAAKPATAKHQVCARCASELEDGFSFCLNCGTDAAGTVQTTSVHSQQAQTVHSGQRSVSMSQATPGIVSERMVMGGRNVQVMTAQQQPAGQTTWSPWAPSVLSFFLPGVGQLANGQVAKGAMLLLALWVALYIFHFPSMGLLMLAGRVIAAVDAYRIAERRRGGRPIRDGEWDLG